MADDDEVCPICHEALAADAARHALDGCGHAFHAACLIGWLRRGGLSCPCCRADLAQAADALGDLPLYERAAHLRRTVARRRTAPPALLRRVDAVRKARDDERAAARALEAHGAAHREVFATRSRLRAARWSATRRVRAATQLLGLFAHPDCPLPALRLAPRIGSRFL